jgi:hypothetical protein
MKTKTKTQRPAKTASPKPRRLPPARVRLLLTPQQVADVLTALAEWELIEHTTLTGVPIIRRMQAVYAAIANQLNGRT